jgi:hypothetical protein
LKREAGLVGLDPRGGGPAALWQATAKSRHSGLGWLQGLVLGKDHCYVALKDAGILVLPGTAVRGVGALRTTRVLGPTDGLPAGTIAAIAGTPERMWVGYGRAGEESGLGLYNALTGQWKTCFSSMVKGDSPLSAGDSYRITQIAPLPEGAALSVSASSALARDGIWHYDLRSDKLQRLAQVPECYLSAGTLEEPWFKNANTLLYLDLKDKTVNVALHGYYDYKVEPADGGWSINRSAFAPQDEGRLLGPWHFGYIDLTTAAVHGDQLWARCGKTQIAVLRRGQKVGDAQKIENNILDGGPVLQFFETPYGLLAVGQGSVGIIETGPDQHAPQGDAAPSVAGGKEIIR